MRLCSLLRTGRNRPRGRNSNSFNEIARRIACPKAQDHANSVLITAGIYDRRNGVQGSVCAAAIRNRSCRLWVKSRHRGPKALEQYLTLELGNTYLSEVKDVELLVPTYAIGLPKDNPPGGRFVKSRLVI